LGAFCVGLGDLLFCRATDPIVDLAIQNGASQVAAALAPPNKY
jgi:hypothetical protein